MRDYIVGTPLANLNASTDLMERCFQAYADTTNLLPYPRRTNHRAWINYIGMSVLAILSSTERRNLPVMFELLTSAQVPCHRDFQPENIIVLEGGTPVIIDFEYYANDNPSIDLAQFCLSSSLSLSIEARLDLLTRFRECLKQKGIVLENRDLVAGAYFWALKGLAAGPDTKEKCNPGESALTSHALQMARSLAAQAG